MKAYENPMTLAGLDQLAKDINVWADKKGFNELPHAVISLMINSREADAAITAGIKGQMIALMHSELSEMLEGLRAKHNTLISKELQLTNEEEELADLIIRALHYAGKYNLRIGEAVGMKMAVNEDRPFKHDKTF